jgi:hypothetical protein
VKKVEMSPMRVAVLGSELKAAHGRDCKAEF